jgi:hypothetical protein
MYLLRTWIFSLMTLAQLSDSGHLILVMWYFILFMYFFFFGDIGVWAQGLMLVRKTLSREPVHHPLRYFNLSNHFHFNFVSFRTSVLYGSFSPCSTKPSAGSHVASHCHILNLLYSGTVPQPFFASMTLANFCVCVCVCVCVLVVLGSWAQIFVPAW